jgi:hypothetical protein
LEREVSYRFELESGPVWEYKFKFDKFHKLIPSDANTNFESRSWTKLEYNKCPNCPLNSATHPQCPIARNLDNIVEDSKGTLSIAIANVTVQTPERTYTKKCSSQDGLRSLFGLIMATSGCPHLDWLRPLARFHLPFSDIDETIFRILSVQLVEQLLTNPDVSFDASLVKLNQRYAHVEKVNHAFIGRIRNYCKADADKNAMAALDVFVQFFSVEQQNNFDSLKKYFTSKQV